jgi:hypothetical protein
MQLWDFVQQRQIRSTARTADSAQREAERAADELADLAATVERLSLTCRAMWELLRERAGVTDEELLDKVRELDLRDGQLDGRAAPAPLACSSCARANNARRRTCLYCGCELPGGSAFDRI